MKSSGKIVACTLLTLCLVPLQAAWAGSSLGDSSEFSGRHANLVGGSEVELPALSGIKVFPTDEDDAAARRNDFLARWQAMVAAAN